PVAVGDAMGGMVQPSVRSKAMADQDQHKVWDEVRNSRSALASTLPAKAQREVEQTSSYNGVIQNQQVRGKLESVAAPIQQEYQSVIRQLRERNAVGVVVAVNGEIVWADVFASPNLLEKYWPKLVRSYAAEAVGQRTKPGNVDTKTAREFLARLEGRREV